MTNKPYRTIRLASRLYYRAKNLTAYATPAFIRGFEHGDCGKSWGECKLKHTGRYSSPVALDGFYEGKRLRNRFEAGEVVYRAADMQLVPKWSIDLFPGSEDSKSLTPYPLHLYPQGFPQPLRGKLLGEYIADYNRQPGGPFQLGDWITIADPKYSLNGTTVNGIVKDVREFFAEVAWDSGATSSIRNDYIKLRWS